MKTERAIAFLLLVLSVVGIALNFLPGNKPTLKDPNGGAAEISKALQGLPAIKNNDPKILVVGFNGLISDGESESFLGGVSASPTVKAKQLLEKAIDDDSVKGVIIRINSPGGTVGMSQEIYNTVMELRKKKPVVASMGDLAASGGYYVASATDIIYANPGTLTGSIGVIIQGYNISELMNKFGVKDSTVKAGKFKDMLSFSRPSTQEELAIVQGLVDDTYQQFVSDVAAGRQNATYDRSRRTKLTPSYVASIAEGLIYTGKQALEIGLVDELGGFSAAEKRLQKIIKARSKGKYKDDLQLVHSLGSDSPFKELFGLSSKWLMGNFQLGFSPVNLPTASGYYGSQTRLPHNFMLLVAPELLPPPNFTPSPTIGSFN